MPTYITGDVAEVAELIAAADSRADGGREAFEAFFGHARGGRGRKHRPTFDRLPDGTYADESTQRHWWTWQNAVGAMRRTT